MPNKLNARAVVAGGGIMGLSVAYHLARRGAAVMLFEKDCIGAHSETHPTNVGLVTAPYFWPDAMAQRMARKSLQLYSQLAKVAGFRYARCGRVYLAASDESVVHVRRIHSRSLVHGEANEMFDCPSEMLARWPLINTEDLRLALHSVEDVSLDNMGLCSALADAAREHGAQIYENCDVKKVMVGEGQKVFAVDTEEGLVETSVFVNCAGIHSNMINVTSVPERCVRVPAWPCTYTMLTAERLNSSNIRDTTPAFVDMDHSTFIYANENRTICGGFIESEITALKVPHGIQAEWNLPSPDWDKFYPILKSMIDRCPSLAKVTSGDLTAGCEMYSPDMYPVIGESEQVKGYFVANGLNGQGLAMAGGLGEILAQWIVEGVSSLTKDISKFDVTRFSRQHTNPQYLYERVAEIASNTFKPCHYSHQCHTARNLRMSPIYHHLRSRGAVFGEIMGYERPLWFADDEETVNNQVYCGQDNNLGQPIWFHNVRKEYEACRERVGLIDMTSFSKFDIQGPDVVELLQKVCSANVDKPIGSTIYTGMQTENGGYWTDCTLSRVDDKKFFIVAPSVQQVRCPMWINKWVKEFNMNVHIQDVTGLYTALDVVGPSSRQLMQDLTGKDMSTSSFPSFSCREMNIGMAAGIRAISVTHCGELGWMLYIPNEVAQNVYEKIVEAGEEYSMLHAGYYALRHLRIEKFYVYWGQDINATVTPGQCGRMFRVDFEKDFIGKEALLRLNEEPVTKRFVQLLVDRHDMEIDPWPQGDEPIYKDGKLCGWTTSAAYGFTLGSQVCIGYLKHREGITQDFINSGVFEIDIATKRFPVRINLHSPSLPMVSSEHPVHYRPTQEDPE
uniref:Pyruvate dehydrogenase phosphatase regulatory subunit, mitochondrial n=1 Tax=Bursaphelenchus xylophilus TaxID=6326 RepID=A0A1I7S0V8_BURXY